MNKSLNPEADWPPAPHRKDFSIGCRALAELAPLAPVQGPDLKKIRRKRIS